ncbi:phosphate signaling complex protein PhoU [Desulfatirhabdium butyrativorans]|uniref:phosphate signaling complex protein PhoU n=1 Tax=Desulfatirhabdium butyrativorans TaxID=340467 RepID=UPI0003FE6990|nr:phosphate signaling complex protein PhoU [Desulfatirhabdium butyrativorans]
MTRHFLKELEKIKKMILTLGAQVEEQVQLAVQAITQTDARLAEKIIRTDHEIDDMEVEVEEECLKVLALHQPVAIDLRFLVAVIKINNDLERIGDEAVNIAQRVEAISRKKGIAFTFDYSMMATKAEFMLKKSLDALVNMDIDLAYKVLILDDEVDAIKRLAYDRIKEAMRIHPDHVGYLINLLLVSRHIERIADHSTNIAEEVIYLIDGEIVRHEMGKEEKLARTALANAQAGAVPG